MFHDPLKEYCQRLTVPLISCKSNATPLSFLCIYGHNTDHLENGFGLLSLNITTKQNTIGSKHTLTNFSNKIFINKHRNQVHRSYYGGDYSFKYMNCNKVLMQTAIEIRQHFKILFYGLILKRLFQLFQLYLKKTAHF